MSHQRDDQVAEGQSVKRFADRVAVVTGGAGLIGAATCRRLAAEGARVVVADIALDAGEALAEEIDGLFVPADLGSAADVEHVYAHAYSRFGRIDLVVHDGPGTARYGGEAVLPYLLERRSGAVVNQVAAGGPQEEVLHFTRRLAGQVAADGIRVTALVLGPIAGTPDAARPVPLGRPGTPQEAAAAVAFLGSDDGAYVTGTSLVLDGGLTAVA